MHRARRRHRSHQQRSAGSLPFETFGALCGTIERTTLHARNNTYPDDNHLYLWLRVDEGKHAGSYELAVNVKSTRHTAPVQFAVREEPVTLNDFPPPGFWQTHLRYVQLGLCQEDFADIEDRSLLGLVQSYAESCVLCCAYGRTYDNWCGMHDIHQNSGERPDSPYAEVADKDSDGALAFYFRPAGGSPVRRWLFLKFATQWLPGSDAKDQR